MGIDVSLGMPPTILVDLVRLSGRFPFKDGGRDTTRVIAYDWWCVIRWKSIRVSHPVVSQMEVADVPVYFFLILPRLGEDGAW